ncbi:hypothetical protein R6Q57_022546 [Mikania cordata]
MSFEVNEDYVQSHTDLYGNQGVHVCMLMEHLVTGKPLNDINLEPEFDGINYIFNNQTEPLHFGPQEFCVITGFKFGDKTNKNKGGYGFINRVLADNIVIPFSVYHLKTLLEEKENIFYDANVVRLLMLLLLYSLFMGVEVDKIVEKEHQILIDDFNAWNDYN